MLKLNSSTKNHSRIALSENEQSIVVIADQIISTLDDDEYRFHAKSVASEAIQLALKFK